MLPTTGFFKDIACPFHDDNCGRPYCHFRHKKKVQDLNSASVNVSDTTPVYNPTPKSQLANVKSHIPITYIPDVVVRTERKTQLLSSDQKPTYNPTPLSVLSTVAKSKSSEVLNNDVEKKSENNGIIDINLEDLTSEFQLLDEILNSSIESCNEEIKEKDNEIKIEQINSKNDNISKNDINITEKSSEKEKKKSKSDKGKHKSDKHKSHGKSRRSEKKSDSHKKTSSKSHSSDKRSSSSKKHEDKNKKSSKSRDSKEKDKSKNLNDNLSNFINNEEKQVEDTFKEEKNSESRNIIENQCTSDDDIDFEDDLEAECFRIFNDYQPSVPKYIPEDTTGKSAKEIAYTPSKKRIAHTNAEKLESIPYKPKYTPNPAAVMGNRLKLARSLQSSNEQNAIANIINKSLKRNSNFCDVKKVDLKKPKLNTNNHVKEIVNCKEQKNCSLVDEILKCKTAPPKVYSINQKIKPKIAPVQNVKSIQKAKEQINLLAKPATFNKTIPQTFGKSTKRVAHIPDVSLSELPDVLQAEHSKLPVNVRTRFLTLLAEECLKLYLIKEDAYVRALTEELKCYEKCSALSTYKNSSMLSVNRLRKELQERESKGLGPILPEDSLDNNKEDSAFKNQLYTKICGYLLTEDQLENNGYPREGLIPGRAVIKSTKTMPRVSLEENERICCRCFKIYFVDDDGFPLHPEDCLYHPLKKRTLRGERTYLCCKSSDDIGCVTSNTHVSEVNEFELTGYQTTMGPESESDPRSHAVYALDCEMCYTTKGLELTRVTIVDAECKIVYESLVKPLNPIIDYNTTFSGITKEQMDRTSTNILQVQANILHLCNSETILIGHSLESDLKALKIIHSKIIDTAILFPHKFGLPHKRALRTLASEYLNKIIQNDLNGHDSAEDAITCMELIIWKVKESMKLRT